MENTQIQEKRMVPMAVISMPSIHLSTPEQLSGEMN